MTKMENIQWVNLKLQRKNMINREKFKTELGKKVYDILKPLAPNEDWLELMIMLSRGDERREILFNFLKNEKDWGKITEFVMKQWG